MRFGWLVVVAALAGAPACAKSDVGAPCNHGGLDAPQEPVITFPALACEQLMCVYAESLAPPADPCETAAQCNDAGGDRFRCVSGRCELGMKHVLERSMCSQTCDEEADCQGGDDDTSCRTGFTCAPLLELGDFCCEKVCVCRDDLDVAAAEDLAADCASGDAAGCCDREPRPAACGG